MTEQELWKEYCKKCHVDEDTPYEAWSFGGDDPDALAQLVADGIKTATASGYDFYKMDDEPLPNVGDLSVILNEAEEAVCVIKETKLYHTRFCEVTKEHAYKEGEGDRSLEYWRNVHKDFFEEEAQEYGISFDDNFNVLCEEFEVVYKPES